MSHTDLCYHGTGEGVLGSKGRMAAKQEDSDAHASLDATGKKSYSGLGCLASNCQKGVLSKQPLCQRI